MKSFLLLFSLFISSVSMGNSTFGSSFNIGGIGGTLSIDAYGTWNLGGKFSLHASFGIGNTWFFTPIIHSFPANFFIERQIEGDHSLLAGAGLAYFRFDDWDQGFDGTISVGYQYKMPKRNMFFQAHFSPVVYDRGDFLFFPWPHLKIGYNFFKYEKDNEEREFEEKDHYLSLSQGIHVRRSSLQYEFIYKEKRSRGIKFLAWIYSNPAFQTDLFYRWFLHENRPRSNWFLQGKLIAGIYPVWFDFEAVERLGYTVGTGIALGYKSNITNRIFCELLVGPEFLTPAGYLQAQDNYKSSLAKVWFKQEGHPLDLQLRVGYRW